MDLPAKVSVIIPTYKRPVTLTRAIDSVLASTYHNVEVIVVDDNNDGDSFRIETEQVMSRYEDDSRVYYLKHHTNKNGSAARNTGIRASTGEYIMFLDDDDEFFPGKIDAQIQFFKSHDKDYAACYTRYLDIKNGKIAAKSAEKKEGNLLIEELGRNLFVHAGSNLMVRRNVVMEINGFDESFLRNQDVEFLVRILKKYKLGFVDVLGLKVYLHPRAYKVDYFDLTEQYLQKFSNEIQSLNVQDQKAIFRMIGLQKARYAFQQGDFRRIKAVLKADDVSISEFVCYLIHLAVRIITHKAYGYPMKKLYRKGID